MTKFQVLGAKNHLFLAKISISFMEIGHFLMFFSKNVMNLYILVPQNAMLDVNLSKDHFKIHLKALKHFLMQLFGIIHPKIWPSYE